MTETSTSKPKAILAVFLAAILVIAYASVPVAAATADPNPAFPQQCAVDVTLVIDRSDSVGDANLNTVKNASQAFVDSLYDPDYLSAVGVVQFNESAQTVIPITVLDSTATASSVKTAIGGITLSDVETGTNWEAALNETSLAANDPDSPENDNANKPADLVVFLTDGRPTAYGGYLSGDPSLNPSTALDRAITAANVVKGEDTRIVAIGFPAEGDTALSSGDVNALQAISGTTASGDVQDVDYYALSDVATLESIMTAIADEFDCGIAVEKTNDAGGDDTFSDVLADEVADEGAMVPYKVTVTNTGSVDLTLSSYEDVFENSLRSVTLYNDSAMTDEVTPGEFATIELAPDASATFWFVDTAPDDGPFQASYENVFNVTAVDDDANEVTDEDPTEFAVDDILPELEIVKDVKEAGSGDAFANSTTVAPGADVVYRVIVSVPADAFESVELTDYEDIIEGVEDEVALFSDESLSTSASLEGETLAPGDSLTVYFAGTAPAADVDSLVDLFRVDGEDNEGNEITVDDPALVETEQVPPELEIVKDVKEAGSGDAFANSTTVAPGADVVYRVVVSVPSDAFETVTITDYEDIIDGVEDEVALFSDESLATSYTLEGETIAPGESITVYFGGTAPVADVDSLVDLFRVDGEDDDGQTITVDDPALVETEQVPPELEIVKDVKLAGSGDAFANSTTVAPGADVVYRVIVTNPADAFESVELTDYEDIIDGVEDEVALFSDEGLTTAASLEGETLAPGDSLTVYFGGTAPAADVDSLVDLFRVDGVDDDGQTITVDDPALVETEQVPPELEIVKDVKEAGSGDAFANTTTVAPGADVVYRVIVSVPADAFESVELTDYEDIIEGVEDEVALFSDEGLTTAASLEGETLAPGDSLTVYFGGTAPAADDDSLLDLFRVDGEDDDGQTITVDDPALVETEPVPPELTVKKYVDADGNEVFDDVTEEALTTGGDVVYEVVIGNPADAFETVDLTDYEDIIDGNEFEPTLYAEYDLLTVVDLTTVSLAPGESVTVYFNGTAPAENDASLTDTFRVDGEDDDGQTVSAEDDATVTTPPALDICPRTPGFWSTHNGDYATGNNVDFTTDLLPIYLGDAGGDESLLIDSDDDVAAIFDAEWSSDSKKSNGITKLYVHLLAAKLNVENGAAVPANVADAISEADAILAQYGESDWMDIKKSDKALAEQIEDLKNTLDMFNNRAYTGDGCIEDWWKDDE